MKSDYHNIEFTCLGYQTYQIERTADDKEVEDQDC